MATLTIRNLPDAVRDALRIRAAQHGRSMEAEAREALVNSVSGPDLQPTPSAELSRRIARVQAEFRKYVPAGVSVVNELIADRRREAQMEDDDLSASMSDRQSERRG